MKLRNKKTGEIRELPDGFFCGDNLKKICEDWEDYEEPKEYWFIDIRYPKVEPKKDINLSNSMRKRLKEIGNYFETQEKAEKAVERLKAWKRLKDKGIVIRKIRHNQNGGDMYWSCPNGTGISDKQIWLDLDLLFGGEE